MRYQTILLAAAAILCGSGVLAQGPANLQPAPGPASEGKPNAGAQPGAAPGPAAPGPAAPGPAAAGPATPGGQPTSAQQSLVPSQNEQEPKLAPGAAGNQGKALPKDNENSGETTTYAAPKPQEEARWPCAQARVSSISAGTIWSGPDPAEGKDWDQDDEVAALAQKLASRRLPLDEVDPLVQEFAKSAGADKDKKLTKLFVGVLDVVNDNRNKILSGIMRYAQGQQRLAERMREESDKISEMQDEATATVGVALDQKNKEFAWDQRIFQERKQALTYVCETPSLLERRVYEIGKRIQAQL